MNIPAIFHEHESNYSFAMENNKIVIRLRVSKFDDLRVYLVYGKKYDYQNEQSEIEMYVKYEDEFFCYFESTIDVEDKRVAYIFKIIENGKTYYYSEDGLTEKYDFFNSFYNFFQIPYINEIDIHKEVKWLKNAVFYQIFIDRFLIGDKEKDKSYINLKWGDKPNPKSFAGGDLKGIIEKLEYIKSLGVNVIYLTPIFSSISNHKYDINDFFEVDKHFGGKKVLKELVDKAHDLGIKIVLDAVFNHCSDQLMQFDDVKKNGLKSKYHNWFIIDGDYPDMENVNYETFASVSYMPKFNTSNPEVSEFLLNVAKYWTNEIGIDGWRLDVSDELSHDFWRQFRKEIKSINEDIAIIGESWHNSYPFLQGDQFDSIMNYAFTKSCLDYFAWDNISAEDMSNKLNTILIRNKTQVNNMMLNLLDSHDTLRFFTQVKKDRKKMLSAIALMIFFPGASMIYYGTEIKMEGGFDPDSRRTFNWNKDEWDIEFMDELKKLLKTKAENKLLKNGDVRIYSKDESLIVERYIDYYKITLNINNNFEIEIFNIM